MNKDRIMGRVHQVKGKIREIAGNAVNNSKLQLQGKTEQIVGKVQANIGDIAVGTKVELAKKHTIM